MVSLVLFRDDGRIWMDTIDDKSVNIAGRGKHEMQRLGNVKAVSDVKRTLGGIQSHLVP